MINFITRIYRFYCFYSSPSKYVLRKTIKKFFSECPPSHLIFEIGGGNNMVRPIIEVASRGEQYITSDIAPTDRTSIVCDGQQLPLLDNTIDLVVSLEVIEHIPNTERFLSEIVRVLKPDGYVLLSMPFLYGRHDFQDFHRWTAQGLERLLDLHGMEVRVLQNRGGTFLTITTLLLNYIHSIFVPSSGGWRARGMGKKMYFGIMTIFMFPIVLLSWLCFGLDLLIDRDSFNPSGFVCIAQKNSTFP